MPSTQACHISANNKTPPRWPTSSQLASEFGKWTSSPKLNRHSIEQYSDQKSPNPTCLEPGYIVLPLNEVARSRIEDKKGRGEREARKWRQCFPSYAKLATSCLSVVDPWNQEADAARGKGVKKR